MTWSLELQNGDLTLGQASLGTVTAEAKLQQDLRCYILESMGTDNMHPGFGSVLQGGVMANGIYNPGVIGDVNDAMASTFVDSEIRRLVRDYQASQLERAKEDKNTYGKLTLSRGEILISLDDVRITQEQDTMTVVLVMTTANNVELTLTLPFDI